MSPLDMLLMSYSRLMAAIGLLDYWVDKLLTATSKTAAGDKIKI